MALTTLSALKTVLPAIQPGDTSQDAALSAIILSADACIRRWIKRPVIEQAVVTEFLSGQPLPEMALKHRPVSIFPSAGILTQNSPTITGIPSTVGLLPGMPAVTQVMNFPPNTAIPSGTIISTVDSSTQVTLTQSATQSGAFSLLFGLAAWIDPAGYFGFGNNGPFPASTQLTHGTDYVLRIDTTETTPTSKSAVLIRLGGGPFGSYPFFWGEGGLRRSRGTLTAQPLPSWPAGFGNIKVIYTPGYATIPDDLAMACNQLAIWGWENIPTGGLTLTSEGYEGYSRSLSGSLGSAPDLGTTRQILSRFREISI
jgi:hypothetical protein